MPVAGLRALLGDSLDYAGLFPPADLPLEKAVRNYAKYQLGADSWFLGRFIFPAKRLTELDPYMPLFAKSAPLLVSALALPSHTWKELTSKLRESLDLIFRFQHSHPNRVRVDSVEIAFPADLSETVGVVETRDLIPAAAETIELSGLTGITPFFELTARDRRQVGIVIDAIERHNQKWTGVHCRPAAFKLRTGGLRAEAFPTVQQVAFVIENCAASGVRFKCTAGLHHSVRHYDDSVGTEMHGFLDIFGAAVLVHARSLSPSDLPSILGDKKASHFQFDEHGFAWKSMRATVEQIASARRDLITSFGSCSFEEPLEDLQELAQP
jgi:hypothetical protein